MAIAINTSSAATQEKFAILGKIRVKKNENGC